LSEAEESLISQLAELRGEPARKEQGGGILGNLFGKGKKK
jgi:hypothetical protein